MSVTEQDNRIVSEAGNDVKVAFDFAFKIFSESDISAYKVDADGEYTAGVLDGSGATGFSVEFDQDDETGVVTWATAPVSGGFSVIIGDALPITQTTAIPRETPLPASSLRDIVDKLTVQVQQLQEQINRAPKQPITPINPDSVGMEAPEDDTILIYRDNGDGTFDIVNSGATYTAIAQASGASVTAQAPNTLANLIALAEADPDTPFMAWATDRGGPVFYCGDPDIPTLLGDGFSDI